MHKRIERVIKNRIVFVALFILISLFGFSAASTSFSGTLICLNGLGGSWSATCNGGACYSAGSQAIAGSYTGSLVANGESNSLTITISSDGTASATIIGSHATITPSGRLRNSNLTMNAITPANNGATTTTCVMEGTPVCSSGLTSVCNGTCADTTSDSSNCGSCGKVCSSGQCSNGQCACPSGLTLCNGNCINTTSDLLNCGACGTVCPTNSSCQSGKCILECGSNETLCGNSCVNIGSDASNCGKCGSVCSTGSPVCTNGQCTLPLPMCAEGQTLCGISCFNTNNDSSNCGSCGNICASNQVCQLGKCALICPSRQTVCGNSCVNTNNDSLNCGSCGVSCPNGNACTNGQCSSSISPLLIIFLLLVIAAIAFGIFTYLGKGKKQIPQVPPSQPAISPTPPETPSTTAPIPPTAPQVPEQSSLPPIKENPPEVPTA